MNKLWRGFLHYRFGQCFTFDPNLDPESKLVPIRLGRHVDPKPFAPLAK